jgi:hypothetical protein
MTDYNKQLEDFLGIGLDDYPGSDYSLLEEYYVSYSKHPRFRSYKYLKTPILGLFDQIEVITFPYTYNRLMTLQSTRFEPAQMNDLENVVNGLVQIYGGDSKGMLWLLEEEKEEIVLKTWKGRIWEFDKYEEVNDVFITISTEKGLEITIKEKGHLLDF